MTIVNIPNSSAKNPALTVLGIETSCDETAAAVVVRGADGQGQILSNVVLSQFDQHKIYGGVVPEIAARAHVNALDKVVAAALREAGVKLDQVDAVAAAAGPGLIGGLVAGTITGKALALTVGKPFLAINHLEAHALTAGLTDGIKPPYLVLLVSGGHTQILLVEDIGRYRRLATTVDDALGEAFDKTAKLLGLAMPGGPSVEQQALKGDATRFAFPRPMAGRNDPNFSFAGLKTAVRHAALRLKLLSEQDTADLCASFQAAVTESVTDRVNLALKNVAGDFDGTKGRVLVAAGGVAANQALRAALIGISKAHDFEFRAPPAAFCTDNGAMIAWAGAERLGRGWVDPFDAPVRPRWPLDPGAPPAAFAGVKA